MSQTNKLERILAALEGKKTDKVPTFSLLFDSRPIDDALGVRHVPVFRYLQKPWVARFIDKTTPIWNTLSHPNLGGVVYFSNALRADVKLGFDAGLVSYYGLRLINHQEAQDIAGRIFRLVDDGAGGLYGMYNGGVITDPESWRKFKKPDPARFAKLARLYFSFMNFLWSGKIALVAGVSVSLHQDITEGMGFTNFVKWFRKDRGFLKDIIAYRTELALEAVRAVALSGIRVIWFADDLAYRSGPMLNPETLEELFGESYVRIADAAHAGGAKILFHSCGNVLDLLQMIADWGYDGVHALEPTAGVTIAEARKRIGSRLCLCGNIDITRTLVDASKEEVFKEVEKCVREAEGGGFILAPTNTSNAVDAKHLRWMVEAALSIS